MRNRRFGVLLGGLVLAAHGAILAWALVRLVDLDATAVRLGPRMLVAARGRPPDRTSCDALRQSLNQLRSTASAETIDEMLTEAGCPIVPPTTPFKSP